MEGLQCGRLVGDVLECPCSGLDLGERYVAPLDAEAREPPQRGTLKAIRLGLAHGQADREGVAQATWGSSPAALRMMAILPVFSARRKRAYADP